MSYELAQFVKTRLTEGLKGLKLPTPADDQEAITEPALYINGLPHKDYAVPFIIVRPVGGKELREHDSDISFHEIDVRLIVGGFGGDEDSAAETVEASGRVMWDLIDWILSCLRQPPQNGDRYIWTPPFEWRLTDPFDEDERIELQPYALAVVDVRFGHYLKRPRLGVEERNMVHGSTL